MNDFKICDAMALWQKETSLPSVATFSQSIDNMLGTNGIQLGCVTELLGLPGSGKTQLCLQLCASIQIPKQLGGLDAEALFVDTNTHFTLTRFREILSASLERCQNVLGTPLQITEDEALSKLHYVNAFGFENYCSLMHRLPKFVSDHPKVWTVSTIIASLQQSSIPHRLTQRLKTVVHDLSAEFWIKLIAIDSIAYPFKDGVSTKQRTGLLFRQMSDLQRIAVQNQIAVVLTNEMSTRVGLSGSSVVGALGDGWAHRCNVRVLLSTPPMTQNTKDRVALLLKSNVAQTSVAKFQITSEGIRDID